MLVRVGLRFEDGGRPLPRNRAATQQPEHLGNLTFTEQFDKEFRRSVYSAHLRGLDGAPDPIPPLRDAVVRWIGDGCMSISGLEEDEMSRRLHAQSWFIQLEKA